MGTTVTVIVAEAVFPPLVPVTVAVPAETAVTVPDVSIVATWGALLAHTTGLPLSGCPSVSDATACSTTVPPTESVAVDGSTATDATATGTTATATMADCPPALAATCAVPTFFPVTTPVDETATTLVSELDQNMVAPATNCPPASCTCACKASCEPSGMAGVFG